MTLAELFDQCLTQTYTHTARAVSYAVTQTDGHLFLWFEWSNGAFDWGRNLNFPAKAYTSGTDTWFCHRGFLGAWKEVRDILAPYITDTAVTEITVVGYSHGAAVALLRHEFIWFTRPDLRDKLCGVGFGCPRVVWGYLPRFMQARFARFLVVRNLNDIVTHLPPAILGYFHVSPLLEIGKKGRYSATDAHRPENYAASLSKITADFPFTVRFEHSEHT